MGKISYKIVCKSLKMPSRLVKKRAVVSLNKPLKYNIDVSQAMEDDEEVIDLTHFVDWVTTKMKPCGKAQGTDVLRVEAAAKKVVVTSHVKFAKRYVKYLIKKYLKAQNINQYLRVVSDLKNGYKVKFIDIAQGEES